MDDLSPFRDKSRTVVQLPKRVAEVAGVCSATLYKELKAGPLDKIFNFYFCFSNHDELLTSGAKIEKLIVSHPALSEPTEIQILYIAYEGWIYSGRLVELD